MSNSHTIEMLMSEFTDLLMLSTSKKTSELSFSRMLKSDSDSVSTKNKKKTSTRSIIDDFFEINIINDSCR